jgi:hypothetical protein
MYKKLLLKIINKITKNIKNRMIRNRTLTTGFEARRTTTILSSLLSKKKINFNFKKIFIVLLRLITVATYAFSLYKIFVIIYYKF